MKKRLFQFEEGLSLRAFWERYGSEEYCSETIFKWKWPNGYHCQNCGYEKYLQIEHGKAYQCQRCRHVTPTYKMTFLLIDKLPLKSLFFIQYILVRLKDFISTPNTRPVYRRLLKLIRIAKKSFRGLYRALLSDEHCAVYIPWLQPPRDWSNLTKLHWCYTRIEWQKRKMYCIFSALAWPLKTLIFSLQRTIQFGPRVKKRTGITKTRQFSTQIYLAFRYFIPPRAFYLYELFDPSNRQLASKFIHEHEIIVLMPYVNSLKDRKILNNKCDFFYECEKAGLATIPVVAEFFDGKIINLAGDMHEEFLNSDLFVKPTVGRQGLGARFYEYQADKRYKRDDGLLLAQDELLNHILEVSREEPYLLQKRIFNHPDISELSTGALCTVRIVTYRRPNEAPEPLISIFKMPTGDSATDNMSTGALGSPVDIREGVLGPAISLDTSAEYVSRHPNTDHNIVGLRLPLWHQVIQLSLSAHNAFPGFSSIAWDIAVTEEGPLLVEGNLSWGVASLQRPHNLPLGDTCFPEIYLVDLIQQKHFSAKVRHNLSPNPGYS